jgi:glycosyltransferase involved in cell wall biosynthesis
VNTLSVTGSLSRNAGGLFESVRRLHQSLAEIPDVNVVVLGLRDEFTTVDLPFWQPVPVQAFSVLGPHRFGFAPRLSKALLEMDCDIVHTHGIWMYLSIAVTKLYRRRKVPYLISTHGMLDRWAMKNSFWKKRMAHAGYEGAHLRNAACVRALCEAEAQAIRKCGLTNPVCVIPNGIDLPGLDGNQLAALGGPLQTLKTSGRRILLYLGRLHPKKGLPNLLKAWSKTQIEKQREEWVLAIAGWDESGHESDLKKLTSDLGILTSVTFLGPQFGEAKMSCYYQCDAFVLPSFSEGFPMVVLEAWAYGKPVLMTSECNLPEGFESSAAIRISTGVQDIEHGLRQLFDMSAADCQTMGERGKKLVIERYSWSRISAGMKGVYDWVLGGGPKPECVSSIGELI